VLKKHQNMRKKVFNKHNIFQKSFNAGKFWKPAFFERVWCNFSFILWQIYPGMASVEADF